MVTRKIQEESLRTYLFTYSSVYDSLSLVSLSEMFELEIGVVHSIISKMIINEELMVSNVNALDYKTWIWTEGLLYTGQYSRKELLFKVKIQCQSIVRKFQQKTVFQLDFSNLQDNFQFYQNFFRAFFNN